MGLSPGRLAFIAVGVAAFGALFALGATLAPGSVAELEVTNPTSYDVDVDVSGDGGESWTPLGIVAYESASAFGDVREQGPRWTFRFRSQGRDGGEMTISRESIERAGWSITVPDSVAARLAGAGAPLPPRRA